MGTSLQKFTAARAESAPVPATIDDAIKLGEIMAASGMFDGLDAPKAIAKVIAGQELGIGPMAAMRGINIIKGKVSLSAELVATLIKRSGRYDFRSSVGRDGATITVFDRGEALEPVTFTLDDAKAAKLTTNENYGKYPGEMCFTKAIIRAARQHCPEVIGGAVYMDDDDQAPPTVVTYDVDVETGEVIDQPEALDVKALAGALIERSGDKAAMVAAMQEAGITSSDLADPDKLAEAQAIAERIASGDTSDAQVADELWTETEHADPVDA